MDEASVKKFVTHPDDVATLKAIVKSCDKEDEWDFSTPGQVGFDDDDFTVAIENGRLTKIGLSLNDLSPLANMTALTELNLSYSEGLSDLSPLAGLTSLTSLGLAGSENLSDLSPLAGLTALTELDLSNNAAISDLSPLAGLTALTWLDLSNTENINDFSPLAGLASLTNLILRGANKSEADLGPLAGKAGLDIVGLDRKKKGKKK